MAGLGVVAHDPVRRMNLSAHNACAEKNNFEIVRDIDPVRDMGAKTCGICRTALRNEIEIRPSAAKPPAAAGPQAPFVPPPGPKPRFIEPLWHMAKMTRLKNTRPSRPEATPPSQPRRPLRRTPLRKEPDEAAVLFIECLKTARRFHCCRACFEARAGTYRLVREFVNAGLAACHFGCGRSYRTTPRRS